MAVVAGRHSRSACGAELVRAYEDDVRLLEAVTGAEFGDWLGDEGRGEFSSRLAAAQSSGSA